MSGLLIDKPIFHTFKFTLEPMIITLTGRDGTTGIAGPTGTMRKGTKSPTFVFVFVELNRLHGHEQR